jgi:hypothetical protein
MQLINDRSLEFFVFFVVVSPSKDNCKQGLFTVQIGRRDTLWTSQVVSDLGCHARADNAGEQKHVTYTPIYPEEVRDALTIETQASRAGGPHSVLSAPALFRRRGFNTLSIGYCHSIQDTAAAVGLPQVRDWLAPAACRSCFPPTRQQSDPFGGRVLLCASAADALDSAEAHVQSVDQKVSLLADNGVAFATNPCAFNQIHEEVQTMDP